MNYRPETSDVRLSLPSNSVLRLGDFGVFLFVCFYTHKKMVDFIYFCIVSHFVFTGEFSGVFFQSCAVSFEAVWVPVPREKRQLLPLPPLPMQRTGTTALLMSPRRCRSTFHPGQL